MEEQIVGVALISLISCSKDERNKVTDKVLGRTAPTQPPASAGSPSGDGAGSYNAPASFTDLLSRANSIKSDGKSYISKYYPDLASAISEASDLNSQLEGLTLHISEAIRLLCTKTDDGSIALTFQGIPASSSKISSVISKLEEALSLAKDTSILDNFYYAMYYHATERQDFQGAIDIQSQMQELSTNINIVLTELVIYK